MTDKNKIGDNEYNHLVDWEEIAKSIEDYGLRNKTLIAEMPIVTEDGEHLKDGMYYFYTIGEDSECGFVGKYLEEKKVFSFLGGTTEIQREHSVLKCKNIYFVDK